MSLTLRARVTLWFSVVLTLALGLFGWLTYGSIRRELNTQLDVSLNKVISNLDLVIRERSVQAQLAPPRGPLTRRRQSAAAQRQDTAAESMDFLHSKDSLRKGAKNDSTLRPAIKPLKEEAKTTTQSGDQVDAMWTAIYERILLTPRNHLIQVMDTTGQILYKTDNLGDDSLMLSPELLAGVRDSVTDFATITQRVAGREGEQSIRVGVARSGRTLIAAGYPVDEIESLLSEFFNALILLVPLVLVVATLGSWFLARTSLHAIDQITQTARAIGAGNLSHRLPVPRKNDEIKRLSETLNDMIGRLEGSFDRVRQFTADASHELRTPLTILTGELELALRTRKTPEQYQDVLSSALQEVLRLSHVVESLLLLSRTDINQIVQHREPTSLTETLADLADAATILGTAKNISITFRPQSEEELIINADRGKLYQMFLNLVDNAVKYTPAGGMITLTVHRDGTCAEVHVRDNGIGIPKEAREKIFDRFYRVDKARSRDLGGAGLGLSIVQWIVASHDGTIRVESEPGKGSDFIVRLPLTGASEVPAATVEERNSPLDVGRFIRNSLRRNPLRKA